MQEHELTEYHRLRAEGCWTAANELRKSERKRLRAGGRVRQQARDVSSSCSVRMMNQIPMLTEVHQLVVSFSTFCLCDTENTAEHDCL